MDLLKWTKGSHKSRLPKTTYAIFIDAPNVENVELDEGIKFFIDWKKLTDIIKGRFGGEKPIYAGAFSSVYRAHKSTVQQWTTRAKEQWERQGFVFETREEKDIDSLLMLMLALVADTAEKQGYSEICFVVVSGDHIVAEVVERVRTHYANRIKISLQVYSWAKSLSGELQEYASQDNAHETDVKKLYQNIFPLDTINGLVHHRIKVKFPQKEYVPS